MQVRTGLGLASGGLLPWWPPDLLSGSGTCGLNCFLRENVAGGPRGLHPCWGPGRRGDTALELGEGPAVFPHGNLAGRANFAEMRVHTRLHRHRHSGTCACVSVQRTNVCVHTCLRVRVCSCQAGKGEQMLSCPKPCTDTSQGLFFGDREGGRATCAQAQGAGLGVNALDPLSTHLIADICHSPCFPGRSLWPRGAEHLAEGTQRICRGTWRGDEGHREGCEGTPQDGLAWPRPWASSEASRRAGVGGPGGAGAALRASSARPALCPWLPRAGAAFEMWQSRVWGPSGLRGDRSHFRSLCPLLPRAQLPRPPCPHPSWACGCCRDHAAAGQHQPPQRQLIGERKRPIVWRAWAAEGAGEGGRLRPAAAAWDICRLRQRRRAGGAGQRGGSAASRPGLPTMRPLSAQSGSFRLSGARAS